MIKLKAKQECTFQFDISIKNMDPKDLKGRFVVMHENIEYAFPVKILGNRNKAQVTVPPMHDIIPKLTEAHTMDASIEFVGGKDYVKAWADTAKIDVAPVVEVTMTEKAEEVKPEVAVTLVEEKREEIDLTWKPKAKLESLFKVSDEAFEAAKKNPNKIKL